MGDRSPRSVVVLAGGISHERDISLRSGRLIADSLAGQGISVDLQDPDAQLFDYLRERQPDVVWPALHGASGEDGSLRGLLEVMGVPFVSAGANAARLAWDKPTAKVLVSRVGL
jgi:D-alanine-D-alanine ligase